MNEKHPAPPGENKTASKTPEEANENIRKSQGDDAAGPAKPGKTGNKPAFDRDR